MTPDEEKNMEKRISKANRDEIVEIIMEIFKKLSVPEQHAFITDIFEEFGKGDRPHASCWIVTYGDPHWSKVPRIFRMRGGDGCTAYEYDQPPKDGVFEMVKREALQRKREEEE